MDGIDPKFVNALCPDDLDRVTDVLEGAFTRMPALMETGIRNVVNGPITYTIGGAPLVGPIPGKRNAFCIVGLRAGLGEGGGHGWVLAQMIVHGEACHDSWCIDPRRFGHHANVELTALKAVEDYQNEFRFHFPHEHRPAKTTPLTPLLAAEGGEFTVVNDWKRVDYIKPTPDFTEPHSFHFTAVRDLVTAEVATVQTAVGLAEVNGFTRFEMTGRDVHAFLDRMSCSRIPRKPGCLGLAYFLTEQGCVKSEATIANLADGRVWYGAAAAAQRHDMDWLQQHLRAHEDVQIRDLTDDHTILVVAGPKARAAMQAVSRDDWSAQAFPWLSVREAYIGIAPAVIMAVSFSGETAFELHLPSHQAHAAWAALRAAGALLGMGLFGARAIESMRLEKGYLHWKSDLLTEFAPYETGLVRFVADKPDFIGKTALEIRKANGPTRRLVTLEVRRDDAPAHPGASVMLDGQVVGTVTSGDWGPRVGKNLAYAFVRPDLAAPDTGLFIDILGNLAPARTIPAGPYDPANSHPKDAPTCRLPT